MILRAWSWVDNAHLMRDVAKLGYLENPVLDVTYGLGNFWTLYRPADLTTSDLASENADHAWDFTALPCAEGEFKTVVLDPPYKLNGRPSDEDARYGTGVRTDWQDRMRLLAKGTRECARVADKYLLVKCMDQVCSGQMRWQTDLVTENACGAGMRKVDRFDLLSHPRPQPEGRRQVHAASNYSTLLVFAR